MNIMELAMQLGKQLQDEEAYINFRIAQQNLEADKELQEKMTEFNNQKIKLHEEMSKENFDKELINEINENLKYKYEDLMKNERMIEFNEAKQKLDSLVIKINTIISSAAEGKDPFLENFELEEGASCSGSCFECSGC